jgi:hypothetical protein
MLNYYAAASALIFAIVAIVHLIRILRELGGADRAAPCAYVSIVDWLDNCGPARNLGIHAIGLKHGTV